MRYLVAGRRVPVSVMAACPASARSYANAAGDVVDQMIRYAREHATESPDQVDDILKSGLTRDSEGLPAARLWLARAEIAADGSCWEAAREHSDRALGALSSGPCVSSAVAQREAGPLAVYTRVSAKLALGEAVEAADTRWDGRGAGSQAPPLVLAARIAGAAAGATPYPEAVEAGEADIDAHQTRFFDEADLATAALSRERAGHLLSQEWMRGGCRLDAAGVSHARGAAEVAVRVAETAARPEANSGGSPGVLASPVRLAEARADALTLEAQLEMMGAEWRAAETALGDALSALSAVSPDSHPRLALPLVLLGAVYSRTARVTLAEGLFREAAKLLRLDPGAAGPAAEPRRVVHPSVGALLGWRYAQLLSALPKRTHEATRWHDLAADYGRSSGLQEPLLDVLGPLDLLRGVGKKSSYPGMLLSIPHRRAFTLGAS